MARVQLTTHQQTGWQFRASPPPRLHQVEEMNFSKNVIRCLKKLINSEDEIYSDFSVEVEDEIFLCHRFVLSACSSFFRVLFQSNMQETKSNSVSLKEISCEAFKQIYGILYLNENVLDKDNCLEVWKAAHFLQIDFIASACQKLALDAINKRNCHRYLWHAKFLDKRLMDKIVKFITSNFDEYKDSECLMELEADNLLSIIRDPNLKTSTEENVVSAVLDWVAHSTDVTGDIVKSRYAYLVPLLSVSRLTSLSPHYLSKLFDHHLIVDNSRARELIFKATVHLSGDRRNYWPPFACQRKDSKWEDVVLMPSGMDYITVFNMMEKKSIKIMDSTDLPRNSFVIFHRGHLYACGYTAYHPNLLSMYVYQNGKWGNVTNFLLSDVVDLPGSCPQATTQNTLWTFMFGEDVIVVHAYRRRLFQWNTVQQNEITPLTSVPTEMPVVFAAPYESSILVICKTPDKAAELHVYDTTKREWAATVLNDGLCTDSITSFYKDDKLYLLTSDAKMYVVGSAEGRVTLEYMTTIPNLSFPLIGALVYFEDLFLFVKESTSTTVWDPYPKSLLIMEMFRKVHLIVTQNPCTCLVPALLLKRLSSSKILCVN